MDTKTQWITLPVAQRGGNRFFYARRRWRLDAAPSAATLRISADCRYRAWLNGRLVGTGPVRGSTILCFYDSYDIAGFLRAGDNELFVEVNSIGERNFCMHSLMPALWAEIADMLATDGQWEVQEAAAWRTDVPHFTMQSGFMEDCDYRVGPDETAWRPAEVVDYNSLYSKELRQNPLPAFGERRSFPQECLRAYTVPDELPPSPRDIPDRLAEEPHTPLPAGRVEGLGALVSAEGACVIQPGEGGVGFIVDFAAEVSGRAEIVVEAPAGTTLQLSYGEALYGDRLATKFSNATYHFTDCFTLKEGVNTVTTAFAERGFRMLQFSLRNFSRPVAVRSVVGVDRRYPFSRRGSFFCSDHRLNRLYDVCAETLSACASDVFMDCPWRERSFWVNDLVVNNAATLHCFGPTALHRHCLEMALSQPHPSGLVSAVVPMPKMAKLPDYIFPATNLFMALMLKDYWLFSGDRDFVLGQLPHIQRIMDSIWQLADAEGILRSAGVTAAWNFFDWSFELNHYNCNGARESMLSSLYIIAAKAFMELAETVGFPCDCAALKEHISLTASNLEKRFVNSATGLLEDELMSRGGPVRLSTQFAHALWLLTGEASEACANVCRKALVDNDLLMPDFYLHYFWFRAADAAGCNDEALSRIRHYWGRCIDMGSPTLYEFGIHGFGTANDPAGSLCHGFGTIPVAFFHESILGVKPLKGGFAEFAFNPNMMGLDFAEGRIPVRDGCIHVRLERGRQWLRVPEGCAAILPDGRRLPPGEHELAPKA